MKAQHTASVEDYLETIAVLCDEQGPVARVSQISKAMGVRMASVSGALKRLSEDGLVDHQKYGYVGLTTRGRRVAQDVFRRHDTLRRFLSEVLSIDPEVAEEEACRMEHSLSSESVTRLARFMEYVSSHSEGGSDWLQAFHHELIKGGGPFKDSPL